MQSADSCTVEGVASRARAGNYYGDGDNYGDGDGGMMAMAMAMAVIIRLERCRDPSDPHGHSNPLVSNETISSPHDNCTM